TEGSSSTLFRKVLMLQLGPNSFQESFGLCIRVSVRLDYADVRMHSRFGVAILLFSVREPGQTPEVTPIRRPAVSTEFLCKRTGGSGSHFFAQPFWMLQPSLEISRRRLHRQCRLETGPHHNVDGFAGEVIDETQVVLALGPDVDVPAVAI